MFQCGFLLAGTIAFSACSQGGASSDAMLPPQDGQSAITAPSDTTPIDAATPAASPAASSPTNPASTSAPVVAQSTAASTSSWGGAYLFSTNLGSLKPALQRTASSSTRLARDIASTDPALLKTIGRQHTYQLAGSLSSVKTLSNERPVAATVIFDIEHGSATPPSEQRNPVGSIAYASKIVHAAGKSFGVAPDGRFLGIHPGTCSFSLSGGIVPHVNWKDVDLVNLQSQTLASDGRCGSGNVAQYTLFVKQAVSYIRAQNPNIVISTEVSLRDSAPGTAIKAFDSVYGKANAVYVAYPTKNCSHCTPANLATVLNALQ